MGSKHSEMYGYWFLHQQHRKYNPAQSFGVYLVTWMSFCKSRQTFCPWDHTIHINPTISRMPTWNGDFGWDNSDIHLTQTVMLYRGPAYNLMNSTEVQNPRRKLDDKCSCLSYVFGSALASAKSAHVFQKLSALLTLRTLSLTKNSSSDSKAFLHFIAFSGSPTAVHRPLHALRYYTVVIPFWTTQSQTSKFDGKTTIRHAQVTYHTLPLGTRYGEVYGNIAREENGWLSRSKFITLLTFKLSSFRENGFLILPHFPRCSRWYVSLDA